MDIVTSLPGALTNGNSLLLGGYCGNSECLEHNWPHGPRHWHRVHSLGPFGMRWLCRPMQKRFWEAPRMAFFCSQVSFQRASGCSQGYKISFQMQICITSQRQVATGLLTFPSWVIDQKGQTCNHGHLGGGNGGLLIKDVSWVFHCNIYMLFLFLNIWPLVCNELKSYNNNGPL